MKNKVAPFIWKMNLILGGFLAVVSSLDNLSKHNQMKYEGENFIATKYDFPFGYTSLTKKGDTISFSEFGNFKSYNEIRDYQEDNFSDEFTFVSGYKRRYFREKDFLEHKKDFDFADLRLKKQSSRFEKLLKENGR